jgi:hypothetical protein
MHADLETCGRRLRCGAHFEAEYRSGKAGPSALVIPGMPVILGRNGGLSTKHSRQERKNDAPAPGDLAPEHAPAPFNLIRARRSIKTTHRGLKQRAA